MIHLEPEPWNSVKQMDLSDGDSISLTDTLDSMSSSDLDIRALSETREVSVPRETRQSRESRERSISREFSLPKEISPHPAASQVSPALPATDINNDHSKLIIE